MIGPVPARSTYAARSRAQVNAAPLTKTRHTHTQTTGEALLLGQDETDPEQKKKKKAAAVYSEEWGDAARVH